MSSSSDQYPLLNFEYRPNPDMDAAKDWVGSMSDKTLSMNITCKDPLNTLVAVRAKLRTKENLAAGILEIGGFSRDDAVRSVASLINDLEFYLDGHLPQLSGITFNNRLSVAISLGESDIPLCGRVIGPMLRTNTEFDIKSLSENYTAFWTFLVDLISECTKETKIDSNVQHQTQLQCVFNPNVSWNTPMIIFDSADIFSAVKSIISSTWEFNGKAYWWPTHVYVQESRFKELVHLLKIDARNFVRNLKFKESEDDTEKNPGLQILQPTDDKPHFRFFVGWDPHHLNAEHDIGKGVVLFPFRTFEEGISCANALSNNFCASIWTEKYKVQNDAARLLNVSTVWVNTHGELDPSTSFRGYGGIGNNGPDLLEYLLLSTQMDFGPTTYTLADVEWEPINVEAYLKNKNDLLKLSKAPKRTSCKNVVETHNLQNLRTTISALLGVPYYPSCNNVDYKLTDAGMEVKTYYLTGEPLFFTWKPMIIETYLIILIIVYRCIALGIHVVIAFEDPCEYPVCHPVLKPFILEGALSFVRTSAIDSEVSERLNKSLNDAVMTSELGHNFVHFSNHLHLFLKAKNVLIR